jgi:hypothetical protein
MAILSPASIRKNKLSSNANAITQIIFCIGLFTSIILIHSPASAHAFGQRYDLPLPLWLFISGGAVTVILSFIIIAFLTGTIKKNDDYPRFNLLNNSIGKCLTQPTTISLIRFIFMVFFLLILAAGFWGEQNPLNNISIVMTWVIAWVGLAFICALLGNFWALINPWDTIFRYLEVMCKKITLRDLSKHKQYPINIGYWPSCIFFLCFAWLEINWSNSSVPSSVATALLIYSIITFIGMLIYGRKTWLKYGECFTVVYTLFSRFSITEGSLDSNKREWFLRPPGIGLRHREENPPNLTMTFFILLLLSTVTYDGYTETETYQKITFEYFEVVQTFTSDISDNSIQSLVDTAGLLSFPIIFVAVYLLFIWLSAFMNDETEQTLKLARIFIFSIVPISIAYHLAHYISLIAIEGQLVIRLISDPFGYGWDLFNTVAYKTDINILNAKFVWYFSVVLIVIGHVIAVYIAHCEAMLIYADRPQARREAIINQIPMIVLMVGYTMLSLWIIAQPIVG